MIIRNSFRRVLSSFHRITASRQLIAISAAALGLNACYNEPDVLGGDLIPAGDKTSVQVTDTFQVAAYTIKTDTLITSNYSNNVSKEVFNGSSSVVLGCNNDKIFGSIKAGFYTRFQIYEKDSLKYIAVRPHADSLILKLKLKGIWGEKNKLVNVRVYRLTGKMDSIKYYNGLVNPNISYHPTQVNEPTVYSGEDTLKIKFTQAFADELMNVDTSTLGSQDNFMQFMKGLYFTIDNFADDKGVLYSFQNSGLLTMHYMKPTSNGTKKAKYYYAIGYLFNYFQHDSTTADPALRILSRPLSSITDNTPQDTVFGIEGFGGVRGLFKLKGAREWKKLMPIAIHRAELRFDIQEHSELPSDSTIKQLYFYSYRSYSSETNVVTEHPLFAKYDNSSYNKAKRYYSIDVTLQLQELLKGKINRDYIIVEPFNVRNRTSSDASAPRDNYMQGLYRTGNNSKPIKLIVTYSKL